MGKFFRKIGLLTVAMMMLSGVAVADDAQSAHEWMREAPNNDLANAGDVGLKTDDNLRRNQTLYWAVKGRAGASNATVIDTSASPPVVKDCTVGTDCSSAPLFISAPSAVICSDGDLNSHGVDETTTAAMRVCSDSTCTDNVSITGGSLVPAGTGVCREFYAGHVYDGFNVGSFWVFLQVTGDPDDDATTLFWIVGN